jgi:hypothetical protein
MAPVTRSPSALGAAVLILLAVVLVLQGRIWCSLRNSSKSQQYPPAAPLRNGKDSSSGAASEQVLRTSAADRAPIKLSLEGLVGSTVVNFKGYKMMVVALKNECVRINMSR